MYVATNMENKMLSDKTRCLSPKNWSAEHFFYHSPTCIVKCVSEYIFLISKKKKGKVKRITGSGQKQSPEF